MVGLEYYRTPKELKKDGLACEENIRPFGVTTDHSSPQSTRLINPTQLHCRI